MAASDESRFAELRAQLARSVSRICPRWLAAQRDDIVQVAVMRLVQVFGENERGEPYPSSYLWKVAYSVVIDEIRRLRRAREVALDPKAEQAPALSGGLDPERIQVGREIGQGIEACLSRLKRERRLAVTLYLMGHSSSEISGLLSWRVKRVENLVYRGLDDLRACLTSRGLAP